MQKRCYQAECSVDAMDGMDEMDNLAEDFAPVSSPGTLMRLISTSGKGSEVW